MGSSGRNTKANRATQIFFSVSFFFVSFLGAVFLSIAAFGSEVASEDNASMLGFQDLIDRKGVESVAETIINSGALPVDFGRVTLVHMEFVTPDFHRLFETQMSVRPFPDRVRQLGAESMCQEPLTVTLMRNGVSFIDVIRNTENNEIGLNRFDYEDCKSD